jgi:hypothetical protein
LENLMTRGLGILCVAAILAGACDPPGSGAALGTDDGAVSSVGAREQDADADEETSEMAGDGAGDDGPSGAEEDAGEPAGAGDESDAAGSTDRAQLDAGQDGSTQHPVGTQPPDMSSLIESVGFEQVEDAPAPFLLFKAGYGSFNAGQIVQPIDIDYDLVEHPQAWPAWRRTPEGVERQTANGWLPLTYKYECAALPKGTTLSGMFEERLSATVGGGVASRQWVIRYRFSADGTFETCDAQKTAIVATGSVKTEYSQVRGTYEIDGYAIVFTREDGTQVAKPFFYDPARPTRLWIDRGYFPAPSTTNTAICVAP